MIIKEIIYVGDPMCSWCWGFAHTIQEIYKTFKVLSFYESISRRLYSENKDTTDVETLKALCKEVDLDPARVREEVFFR